MSPLVALEWDAKEARVAIGRKRGSGVAVEQAFAVPLPQREEGATAEADVGAAIGQGAGRARASPRSEALVAVGRASIELRFLSTPPVPARRAARPGPLPGRCGSSRRWATIGRSTSCRSRPMPTAARTCWPRPSRPTCVEQIRKTARRPACTLARLVLRPFAAASLLEGPARRRQVPDDRRSAARRSRPDRAHRLASDLPAHRSPADGRPTPKCWPARCWPKAAAR